MSSFLKSAFRRVPAAPLPTVPAAPLPTVPTAIPIKLPARGGLKSVYDLLKPVSISEVILFILLLTAIYILTALTFYNDIQLKINTSSQCYLAKKAITSTGAFIGTAQNGTGNPLYRVSYDMPSKTYSVDCACKSGPVTNTYENIDVYNLETRQTMRIPQKICKCDKQYYVPGYDSIYFSGYPGVTRFMNSASTIGNASDVQTQADTSFFDAALNPKEYYNTY